MEEEWDGFLKGKSGKWVPFIVFDQTITLPSSCYHCELSTFDWRLNPLSLSDDAFCFFEIQVAVPGEEGHAQSPLGLDEK